MLAALPTPAAADEEAQCNAAAAEAGPIGAGLTPSLTLSNQCEGPPEVNNTAYYLTTSSGFKTSDIQEKPLYAICKKHHGNWKVASSLGGPTTYWVACVFLPPPDDDEEE
jgi:hypothetical protein